MVRMSEASCAFFSFVPTQFFLSSSTVILLFFSLIVFFLVLIFLLVTGIGWHTDTTANPHLMTSYSVTVQSLTAITLSSTALTLGHRSHLPTCHHACELLGICDFLPVSPVTLLGGNQQDVLRRSLLNDPQFLLSNGNRDCRDCCH